MVYTSGYDFYAKCGVNYVVRIHREMMSAMTTVSGKGNDFVLSGKR